MIDHRISGGLASKMMKELIKYPLKTSKMEIVVKYQNRKKLSNLAEEFAEKLATKVSALKVGDGSQEGIEQGPLINIAAVEKVDG